MLVGSDGAPHGTASVAAAGAAPGVAQTGGGGASALAPAAVPTAGPMDIGQDDPFQYVYAPYVYAPAAAVLAPLNASAGRFAGAAAATAAAQGQQADPFASASAVVVCALQLQNGIGGPRALANWQSQAFRCEGAAQAGKGRVGVLGGGDSRAAAAAGAEVAGAAAAQPA